MEILDVNVCYEESSINSFISGYSEQIFRVMQSLLLSNVFSIYFSLNLFWTFLWNCSLPYKYFKAFSKKWGCKKNLIFVIAMLLANMKGCKKLSRGRFARFRHTFAGWRKCGRIIIITAYNPHSPSWARASRLAIASQCAHSVCGAWLLCSHTDK